MTAPTAPRARMASSKWSLRLLRGCFAAPLTVATRPSASFCPVLAGGIPYRYYMKDAMLHLWCWVGPLHGKGERCSPSQLSWFRPKAICRAGSGCSPCIHWARRSLLQIESFELTPAFGSSRHDCSGRSAGSWPEPFRRRARRACGALACVLGHRGTPAFY